MEAKHSTSLTRVSSASIKKKGNPEKRKDYVRLYTDHYLALLPTFCKVLAFLLEMRLMESLEGCIHLRY